MSFNLQELVDAAVAQVVADALTADAVLDEQVLAQVRADAAASIQAALSADAIEDAAALAAKDTVIAARDAEIVALKARIAELEARPTIPPVAPLPTISVNDVAVLETAGNAVFTVLMDVPYEKPVKVDWTTVAGTAIGGQDYTVASGTVTFASGETSKTVSVAVINDTAVEGTETFSISLTNARVDGQVVTIVDGTGVATITSEDVTPPTTPPTGLPAGAVTTMAEVMALDATNTGCRTPRAQLTTGGGNSSTANGQVIRNRLIPAQFNVSHSNVVIEDCIIEGSASYGIYSTAPDTGGVTVQYCTFIGTGTGIQNPVGGGSVKLIYRCNMSGCENGWNVFWGPGYKAVNNWVHDLRYNVADPHYDNMENNGGVSGFEWLYNKCINTYTQTSACMTNNYFGPINSGLVKGNYLEGAGYTFYADGNFNNNNLILTLEDNRIKKGIWGHMLIRGTNTNVTQRNNTLV